jgi:hypothetical protein
MTQQKSRPIRGLARVTFRANANVIRNELEQGWTAKAIFDRHHATLGTMSYRQFIATSLRNSALMSVAAPLRRARFTAVRRPLPTPPRRYPRCLPCHHKDLPVPDTNQAETFNHDPLERPGDRRRLPGEE